MVRKKKERGLVSHISPNSIVSEQYRTIRTNIYFLSVDHKYKTLLITSPGYKEGKSTTVTNLAISMVQQGEKVLVIDADLRKPTLHTTFNIDNTVGLTTVLIGETNLGEGVKQTEIQGLDIMTSGPVPSNPAELLSSTTFDKVLESIQEIYTVVLFDSPPVLELTDARILANKCEGTILVVGSGKTQMEEAIETKRLLGLARANCIGVILNKKK
ncbi:capsular exopolysaccharide synthesis family protein [Bacillus fengqiuensis]|nr:capsular exopolysaccharide synthesis family protein [Bacillus fengqiuensis]